MKKNFTLAALLVMLMTSLVMAQDNEVKIEISRDVDGEKKTFRKTYESEEEMKNDHELKEFMGDDTDVQFWFGNNNANIHTFNFDDLDEQMQNFSFSFGDDDENGHSFMFFSDDDSTFSKQFNLRMEEMSKYIDEDMIKTLKDMQQNMIIDLHKNGNFAYAFGDSIDDTMVIRLGDDAGKSHRSVHVVVSKSINITEDTDAFGKKGKVAASDKLELENLSYYPNPATNGRFKLRFDVPEENEVSIKIYNLDGREIFNRYFDAFDGTYAETIDLSGQSEGIYLLEIQMEGKRLTRKIAID